MRNLKFILNLLLISIVFSSILQGQSKRTYVGKLEKVPVFSISKTGAILYNQLDHPSQSWIVSSEFSDPTNAPNTSFTADDFIVPTGMTWNVAFVSVLGYNSVDITYSTKKMNIIFYEDNNGVPGNAIYTYEDISNINETPTSIEGVNQIEIVLPSTASFTEGKYWMCAQAVCDYPLDGQWNWEMYDTPSTIADEFHWKNPADGFGTGFIDWTTGSMVVWWPPYDMAFALYDEPLAFDIAVVEMIAPETGEGLTNTENVTVKVKNEGAGTITDFDVSYQIYGGTVVTENVTGVSIALNAYYEYTFTAQADFSIPGEYEMNIDVALIGDGNPNNDSFSSSIYNLGTIYSMENGNNAQVITTCSGTFTDPGGLYAPFNFEDYGTTTIYPGSPGSRVRLVFLEWNTGWSTFTIYNGEDTNAPMIGTYDQGTGSPGVITALNTTGALTIDFAGSGWDNGDGWVAYISCYDPPEDDLGVIGLTKNVPAVFANMPVTFTATIQNLGTLSQTKDVTFTANGITLGSVSSGEILPTESAIVDYEWIPAISDSYTIEASVPVDQGTDDNNAKSFVTIVYPEGSLFESFEGETFPPEFWSTHNFGRVEDAWTFDGNYKTNIYVPYEVPEGDTLITPQLHIELGDQISFAAKGSLWWPGMLTMYWKDGTTGEWHVLEELTLNQLQWEVYTIDLSAAAGNNFIGFHAWFNDPNSWGGEVNIDYVIGNGPELYFVDHDLIAKKVEGDIVINEDQTHGYMVKIKNIGAMDTEAGTYTVKLMQETESGPVELGSTPGLAITSLYEKSYSFDVSFADPGNTAIYAEIDYAEDMKPVNNVTTPINIYVKPAGTVHQVIGEGQNIGSSYPISGGSYELTQSIYYAEELGTSGVLNGMSLFYENTGNSEILNYPIQLWLVENDSSDVAGEWIPLTQMQKVFDGTLDFRLGYQEVHIPFDNDFIYTGQNVVFMINALDNTYYPVQFYYSNSPEIRTRYANDWSAPINPEDLSIYWASEVQEYLNVKFTILPVEFGSISGIVTDESVSPMEGVQIHLEGYSEMSTSGSDGSYSFDYVPNGTLNLTASVFGYEDNTQSAEVTATQNTVLDFTMIAKPNLSLTGHVVGNNELTAGLENVDITLTGYNYYNTLTSATGDFEIDNVYGNASYTLTISHPDYESYTENLDLTNQNVDLGTIVLTELLKIAYNVSALGSSTQTELTWGNPQTGVNNVLAFDDSFCDNGYAAEVGETVSIGNFMPIDAPITLTGFDLYFAEYVNGNATTVTLELYDINQNLIFESEAFMTGIDEWVNVDIPNLSITDDFYAMVKWDSPTEQSSFLGVSLYGGAPNYAYYVHPGESFDLLSNLIGNEACMLIHANTVAPGTKTDKSVTEYTVYRGLYSDIYNFGTWTSIGTASGESYTDTNGAPTEPGDYIYAVEAQYFGGTSSATFSNILHLTIDNPGSLTADVSGNDVTLNWNAPDNSFVDHYNIYLDDMMTPIATSDQNSYLLENLAIASYIAGVSAVYNYGESDIITVDFDVTTVGVNVLKPIGIYPNPATDRLFVKNAENGNIEIYNGLGVLVKKLSANKDLYFIDLSDLPSGAYFIRIVNHGEVYSNKFNIFK